MTEKDPRGDIASQRPRSPRVPVEFDLNVEGTDASGQSFTARAKAVKISRGGATLQVDVDVALGSQVKWCRRLVVSWTPKLTAHGLTTSTATGASESDSSMLMDGSRNRATKGTRNSCHKKAQKAQNEE